MKRGITCATRNHQKRYNQNESRRNRQCVKYKVKERRRSIRRYLCCSRNELQQECDRIGGCNVGETVITSGYKLRAKYIIHTAGPIWQGGNNNEEQLLHNCYTNSLNLALLNKCRSIAFPVISSGIYRYPKDKAFNTRKSSSRI